ncbi:hypothetical protein CLAFUW4_03349 [Fulvia fulva]|nr:hypothetical protein CLAFUR4_03338 [Fulvia fulva]WPV11297.1 hypothetical protein CLAFUW4_03349 [Fulvia fulva]WPV26801.1 hypothetical protein CLAFUW7_03341 [Fulvia fulva]
MDSTAADHEQTKVDWNVLGPKLYRLELLEAENKFLRTQIEILTKKAQYDTERNSGEPSHAVDRSGRQQTVSSSATIRGDDLGSAEDWKRKYNELKKEHIDLQDKCANHAQEMKLKNEKVREARESVKAWKAYADKQIEKRDAKIARGSRPPSHAGLEGSDGMTPTPRALPMVQTNPEADHTEPEVRTNSDAMEIPSSPPRSNIGPPGALSSHSPARSATSRVTSSQTTVDTTQQRPAPELTEKVTSSDSEPVLVSTRFLKRKARTSAPAEPAPRRIKQEPKSADAPMHIKSEDFSSPHTTPTRLIRTELSDLDNVGPLMVTPRRRHRNKDLPSRATSEEAARLPPTLIRTASSLSEGDPGAQDESSTANTAAGRFAAQRVQAQPLRVAPAHGSNRPYGNVLRPTCNNIAAAAGSGVDRVKPKAKVRRTGAKDHVNTLSEAGDSSPVKPKHGTGSKGQPARGVDTDHRLDDMLATQDPSHGPTPTLRRDNNHTESWSGSKSRASPHLPTPVSMVKRASPIKQRSPVKVPRGIEKPPPNVRPEDEHLRLKNVKELKLADFKINPKYLGTEYAWADTLRGRDQRRALHTCTDPTCCGGAMQKAIEMAGTELSGKPDRQVLEAFLGPTWEAEIGAYNTEKRKEVVKQAHIFSFSNQHGKHKTAFQRRSTPPGFWDTDFPTTQEHDANRVQAKEAERREVEQRYREAMRESGRWKFRDE